MIIAQAVTSTYIESCLLSPIQVGFELDRKQNKFKKIEFGAVDDDINNDDVDDNANSNITTSIDHNENTTRSLLRGEKPFLISSSLTSSSQRRPSSLSDRRSSSSSISSSSSSQAEIIYARECACGTRRRNTTTYCLISPNDENHCRVPNSKDYPVECFNTSNYKQFITNAWPLSLLWFFALIIYLISTEAGRCTIKYACSKFVSYLCCCCPSPFLGGRGGRIWGNSRLIDNIISRETAVRDLFHIASLTRAVEEQQRQDANRNPVTYVLKTKAYSSPKASDNDSQGRGDSMKKPVVNHQSSIEMTDLQKIDQSPSNETMMTTPESIGSPTSMSSSFEQYDVDENNSLDGQEVQRQPARRSSNDDTDTHQCSTYSHCSPSNSLCDIISPPQNACNNDNSDKCEDEDEDEVMCTICMIEIEDGDRVGALPCNHLFHVDCLKEWIKRRNVCPLCQTPIAEERNSPNDEEGGNTTNAANPIFTVRTTGSPIELAPRRRTRRSRTTTTTTARTIGANGEIQNMQGTRRQLFYASSEGRIPPMLNARAGVAIVTVAPSGGSNSANNRNNRNVRILVGDAASATPSSVSYRIRNSFS